MTDITQADIAKLKEAAEKATPGPWTRKEQTIPLGETGESDVCFWIEASSKREIVRKYWDGLADEEPDFDYISLANPATILALISENERLRKERDDMKAKLDAANQAGTFQQGIEAAAKLCECYPAYSHGSLDVHPGKLARQVADELESAIRNFKPEASNG